MKRYLTLLTLLIIASASSALGGEGYIRQNPNAVQDEYIVVLNDDFPAADVEPAAAALAHRYGGALRNVWTHAVKGFFVIMPQKRAEAMSHEPRIRYVEQNARLSLSATQNTTLDPQSGSAGVDYTAGDDILWHLDRIDQPSLPLNNAYNYCSTGSNVPVYVVDSGVMRSHTELSQITVTDGYDGTSIPWKSSTLYHLGDAIRDTVNHNTWICISPSASGTSGGSSPNFSGPAGTVVNDHELKWQNFGIYDPAYNPCQRGGGTGGWPVFASSPEKDQTAYVNEVQFAGHGTSAASMVAGKNVGVARNAIIVPVKVIRCDWYEARTLVVGQLYHYGDRVIAASSGHVWICTVEGTPTSDSSTWTTLGGATIEDNTAHFLNLGGFNNLLNVGTLRMAVDGIDWILDSSRNPNAINHTIATFSTYHDASETGISGSGSFEEAVQNLIAAGVTVFASANNQNGDACDTSPARLSRNNTNLTNTNNKVITVGGSMLVDANGVEGRWVRDAADPATESGSNTGKCVTLFAPARKIRTAQMSGAGDYRRFVTMNGLAANASGTSFSAPMAAGAGAQFLQLYPGGGPDDVYNALMNSAAKNKLDSSTLQGNVTSIAPNLLLQTTNVWIYSSPSPPPQTVTSGTQVTLSVSAVGTSTLSYQWYAGAAGDTSNPLGTSATQSVTPTASQTYWCRVSTPSCNGGTSSLDSPLYSVTVSCTTASIPTQPAASPSVIAPGGSSTLTIGVAGSSPTVQWYTSQGVLVSSGTSITVNPTATTTYHANVSNSCTQTITSSNVTVTVLTAPANFSAHTDDAGNSVTISWLAVPGAASYQVQWSPTWNGTFSNLGSPVMTTSKTDGPFTGAAATRVYIVYAINGSATSPTSAKDYATVAGLLFNDASITVKQTLIAKQHIVDLRNAVDAVRAALGTTPATWVDPLTVITADSVKEVRDRLNDARNLPGVGLGNYPYSSSIVSGNLILKSQMDENRDAVK